MNVGAPGRGLPVRRRTGHPAGRIRRHAGIAALLSAGLLLRVLVVVGYWPAFWYPDSTNYLWFVRPFLPDPVRPNGYPAVLWALQFTGDLAYVAIVQHLVGLVLVLVLYGFLRRRAVARWLAVLGAAPLALDPRLVVMEHYIMAESLFIGLVVAGLVILAWPGRPGPLRCAGAAAVLAAAALTRTIGLSVAVVALAYLVVGRAGWRQVAVYLAVLAGPLAGYAAWFHAFRGHYALTDWQGRFLYARVAQIADCGRLPLDAQERTLCPPQPPGQRPERADWFLWSPDSPAYRTQGRDADALLRRFAVTVITHQPRDYLALVARDSARFFLPGQRVGPQTACLNRSWVLADGDDGGARNTAEPALRRGAGDDTCQPYLTVGYSMQRTAAPPHSPLRAVLAWYSDHVRVPGLALLLGLFAAVRAVVRGTGRRISPDGLAGLLMAGAGATLAVAAFATAMLDFRFGIPAVPLMACGGVLAGHVLVGASGRPGRRCGARERSLHRRASGSAVGTARPVPPPIH